MTDGINTRILTRSREIATTAGLPRRVAIVTGALVGSGLAIQGHLHGSSIGMSILWGVLMTTVFTAVAVFGLAQSQVLWPAVSEPRPERSLAAAQASMDRLQTATWIMVAAALPLAIYAALR